MFQLAQPFPGFLVLHYGFFVVLSFCVSSVSVASDLSPLLPALFPFPLLYGFGRDRSPSLHFPYYSFILPYRFVGTRALKSQLCINLR